jgi:phage antirepressor YoqD-like protein
MAMALHTITERTDDAKQKKLEYVMKAYELAPVNPKVRFPRLWYFD